MAAFQFSPGSANPNLDALIADVTSVHPGADSITQLKDAVAAAGALTDHADHLVGHFVDAARAAGASWSQIGEGLGVSKQAVQQRFVPREPATVGVFESSFKVPSRGRFGRFTERARHCVVGAKEVAYAAGNSEVGSVHILLGLFAEPEGLAARALPRLGADAENIRRTAVELLPAREQSAGDDIAFNGEGKKILDLTLREALRMGHNYVGTEHLLLALLSDPRDPAAELLAGCGVGYEAAKAEVEAMLVEAR